MKIVSVITARGGSKGVPRKNIVDVNGKPLIWYSIKASLDSIVDETWVSTEDKEIKKISLLSGAKVIDRPKHLADDIIMPDPALLHAAENIDFDVLVFIQPCAALIKPKFINEGVNLIIEKGYDSSFAVVRESWMPVWTLDVKPIDWDIHSRPRRQDKEEWYKEAGMFYVTTREALLQSGLRYSGNIGTVEIPLKDSFQIDNYQDLELLRKVL
ncbi:MAG: putative cytidylyltransferase [Prokaryotic dsDNA virus sp.]|nr:MAG: putative cytidylyltransferase [Prokaryotic dsDNA virus sp.]|tara:strand:- start:4706 stop:5344 length:639 start_codon:yes stop_codon:yes gene_type:complete